MGEGQEFIADGCAVYGFAGPAGQRVLVATAESPTWAAQIAELMTNDPDTYTA